MRLSQPQLSENTDLCDFLMLRPAVCLSVCLTLSVLVCCWRKQSILSYPAEWTELKLIRDFGGVEQQNCHMQIVVRFNPMGDFANPFNALNHEPWLDFCLAFYFSIG